MNTNTSSKRENFGAFKSESEREREREREVACARLVGAGSAYESGVFHPPIEALVR